LLASKSACHGGYQPGEGRPAPQPTRLRQRALQGVGTRPSVVLSRAGLVQPRDHAGIPGLHRPGGRWGLGPVDQPWPLGRHTVPKPGPLRVLPPLPPRVVDPRAIAAEDAGPGLHQGRERPSVAVGRHLDQGDGGVPHPPHHVNTPCWYQPVSFLSLTVAYRAFAAIASETLSPAHWMAPRRRWPPQTAWQNAGTTL
jgi:hypothetical protein